jgi:hypothetical protein
LEFLLSFAPHLLEFRFTRTHPNLFHSAIQIQNSFNHLILFHHLTNFPRPNPLSLPDHQLLLSHNFRDIDAVKSALARYECKSAAIVPFLKKLTKKMAVLRETPKHTIECRAGAAYKVGVFKRLLKK